MSRARSRLDVIQNVPKFLQDIREANCVSEPSTSFDDALLAKSIDTNGPSLDFADNMEDEAPIVVDSRGISVSIQEKLKTEFEEESKSETNHVSSKRLGTSIGASTKKTKKKKKLKLLDYSDIA